MRIIINLNQVNILPATSLFLSFFLFSGTAFAEPIKIVATIFPIADITKQLAGDEAEVYLLLKPGRSPHTFEPTPKDLMNLISADVVIRAGFGLEPWLDKLLQAPGSKNRVIVDLSSAIKEPLYYAGDKTHHHVKEEGAKNPHFWLDPILMIEAVRDLRDKLVEIKPISKDNIYQNSERIFQKLSTLDLTIRKTLSTKQGLVREVVAFHGSWDYFATRYDFSIAGVIERSPDRKPSARHFAKLVGQIREKNIKGVMVEPQMSPKLGEALATETGGVVVTVDPIGGQKGRGDYFELMRWNAMQFKKAMEGRGDIDK